MGMTMAEKILARHAGRSSVTPGEYVWASLDGTAFSAGYARAMIRQMDALGIHDVWDPDRLYAVEDHQAPAPTIASANNTMGIREFVRKYGITHFFEWGRHGILHELYPNNGYLTPGDLIASIDSHTTSYGCFNVASCGIMEECIFAAVTGKLWFRVPESIRFNITGKIPGPENFVVGKDVILRIAAEHGTDVAIYKSIEFLGPAVHDMTMDSRFTISNMGVELGGKFAIFPCDDKTLAWFEGKPHRPPNPVEPDPDAKYDATYTLDVTDLSPYVAKPHDPSNGVPVTEVEQEKIRIDQAFIGACTNARMEDFRMAARILKGRKVAPHVRLIATPASQAIWRQCLKEGIWDILSEAEVMVTNSTCGACPGMHLGLIGDGEVCVSSTNRNFQGRMGSPKAFVYLASPATVAASAVTGYITDPRKFL